MLGPDGEAIFNYSGKYVNGVRCGQGTMEFPLTGVTLTGRWKDDKLVEGTFTSPRAPPEGESPIRTYTGAQVRRRSRGLRAVWCVVEVLGLTALGTRDVRGTLSHADASA
jgi:hypothetical protein